MIQVKNLSKNYGEIEAVKNISFSVKKGEVFAFLGENGAGKSTTINILCTMLKKNSGCVRINGYELDKDDDKIRKSIGVVFQNSYLDDLLTVYENLYTRAILYGYTKEKAKEKIDLVIKRLDMTSFIKRRYGQLSGGQRRRADIARAILHSPKVLFLDEPTTGLDPSTRIMVWDSIKQLQQEFGMTVFFSTHYMEETEVADRIAIIKRGEIAEIGSPYQLKQKYSYDSLNLFGMNMDKIKKYLNDNNYQFSIINDFISVKLKQSLSSIAIINDLKKELESFEVRKGNMDDVFIAITGEEIKKGEKNI